VLGAVNDSVGAGGFVKNGHAFFSDGRCNESNVVVSFEGP
jgi:hypothetical protein